jgi:hypothetical protein
MGQAAIKQNVESALPGNYLHSLSSAEREDQSLRIWSEFRMKKWPSWDHWKDLQHIEMHEDGSYTVPPNDGIPEDELDFVDAADYETGWSRRWWWTADEATALSFGKSPTALPYDKYMQSMDGSSQFATEFCAVREHILEAQRDKVLYEPKIPTKMFIEWAQAEGISLPPELVEQVTSFYTLVTSDVHGDLIEPARAALPTASQANEAAQLKEAITPPAEAVSQESKRERNTDLGIIYVLALEHYRLSSRSPTDAGDNITQTLEKWRPRLKGIPLEGSTKTIGDRLRAAMKHFGKPQKPEDDRT